MKINKSIQKIARFDYIGYLKSMKYAILFTIVVFVIICLLLQWIQIEIVINDYNANVFFALMNALTIGAYFTILGLFNKGTTSKKYRIFLILLALFLLISGLGTINLKIHLNFLSLILTYYTYSTSSIDGVLFFFGIGTNVLITTGIIGVSFLFESESYENTQIGI